MGNSELCDWHVHRRKYTRPFGPDPHAESVIAKSPILAGSHAGIEATEATMSSVDRLGFSLRLKTTNGVKGARINFLYEVATPQDTRAVLVEMYVKPRHETNACTTDAADVHSNCVRLGSERRHRFKCLRRKRLDLWTVPTNLGDIRISRPEGKP